MDEDVKTLPATRSQCKNISEGCDFFLDNMESLADVGPDLQDKPKRRYGNAGQETFKVKHKHTLECTHSGRGCQFKIENTLAAHERICPYRPVSCPDGICQLQVPLASLVQHIKEAHPDADWEDLPSGGAASRYWYIMSKEHFGKASCNWALNIFKYEGEHFAARFRKKGGQWFTWIHMLAGYPESPKYEFIVATPGSGSKRSHRYKGPVLPIDQTEDSIISTGECLVMTDAIINLHGEAVNDERKKGYDKRLSVDYVIKNREKRKDQPKKES